MFHSHLCPISMFCMIKCKPATNPRVCCDITSTSPLGIRGVATYRTKKAYSATMHSVTLVSGNPSILMNAFRRAGSPKPSTTVRKTENATRSTARSAGSEAILAEWCVYFPGGAVRFTAVTAGRRHAPRITAATSHGIGKSPIVMCNRKSSRKASGCRSKSCFRLTHVAK